jgi:hypothetical protein
MARVAVGLREGGLSVTETEDVATEPSGRCFDVYRRADGTWETIKQGFSWPAFLFGPIWAWVKGLVGIGFALLGLNILLRVTPALFVMLFGPAGLMLDFVLTLGAAVWVGSKGSDWRRGSMPKRGFQLIAQSVAAPNGVEAIRVVSDRAGPKEP